MHLQDVKTKEANHLQVTDLYENESVKSRNSRGTLGQKIFLDTQVRLNNMLMVSKSYNAMIEADLLLTSEAMCFSWKCCIWEANTKTIHEVKHK